MCDLKAVIGEFNMRFTIFYCVAELVNQSPKSLGLFDLQLEQCNYRKPY